MSRNAINFILDCCLLLAFLALLWTSIVLRGLFPAGPQAAEWRIFALDYDTWSKIQFGELVTMALLVLLHLIMHWTWVCGFVAARMSELVGRRLTTNESTRTAYGVSLLIAILCVLGFFLFLAQIGTHAPKGAL